MLFTLSFHPLYSHLGAQRSTLGVPGLRRMPHPLITANQPFHTGLPPCWHTQMDTRFEGGCQAELTHGTPLAAEAVIQTGHPSSSLSSQKGSLLVRLPSLTQLFIPPPN